MTNEIMKLAESVIISAHADGKYGLTESAATAMCKAALEQPVQPGLVLVPLNPTEEMWGGLARDIVFWLYMTSAPHHGSKLYDFLRNLGREIPEWLSKEISDENCTPSKGTVAACIYKAMIEAAPIHDTKEQTNG